MTEPQRIGAEDACQDQEDDKLTGTSHPEQHKRTCRLSWMFVACCAIVAFSCALGILGSSQIQMQKQLWYVRKQLKELRLKEQKLGDTQKQLEQVKQQLLAITSIKIDFEPSLSLDPGVTPFLQCGQTIGLVSYPRKRATIALALRAAKLRGDFVETGVFDGGTTILMSKVMMASEDTSRLMWAADSWVGLPDEDIAAERDAIAATEGKSIIAGKLISSNEGKKGDFAVGRKNFEANLVRCGLGDNSRIKRLQGWFKDTLPKADIKQIAFLRLDGDIFISTWQAITILYDKVVPGGYIYVDDYGSFIGCRSAIDKFLSERNEYITLHAIPEFSGKDGFEAVWWKKPG